MYVLRSATLRLVLAAALASAGCIQFGVVSLAPGEATLSGDGGALPVQWVRQFAFLEVSLDGGAPRRFLLDTGASVLVVTPAVASELSRARGAPAAEARDVRITGADDAVGTAHGIVRIAELRCGPP